MRKRKLKVFKPGDPIEITAIDHTSDDGEGWRSAEDSMKSTPLNIHTRGYFVGEDENTVKIAFAKCGESFSTIFNIVKGTILSIK